MIRQLSQRARPLAQQQIRAMSSSEKIIYTMTDEAPALATRAFLPVIARFVGPYGIPVELSDISVAARIISQFPERMTDEQRLGDTLGELGGVCKTPEGNVIKLPNVSASIPQLLEAIAELQGKGYDLPEFPANPANAEEEEIKARYSNVLGSAVNPVLREGNSDRRAAGPVKAFAQQNPKRLKPWSSDSPCHVAHMSDNDFFSSEKSLIVGAETTANIVFESSDGSVTHTVRGDIPIEEGDVIDASVMNAAALKEFFSEQVADAKEKDILLSLHLKATMMKISDPIMFGHMVHAYFKEPLEKHADKLAEIGVNLNNGFGDVVEKVAALPEAERAEIEADLKECYENGPRLAMVDSRNGITNLHVPSDVIIDASMPNVVRDGGMMWNKDDALEPCKCVIPDRSYATIYSAIVNDCIANGAFDPSTMGHVSNVGLMAKKAEEYGSHPNTYEAPSEGTITVSNDSGTLFEYNVEEGDIFRMAQTKAEPIKDWVRLAVSRAQATGAQTVFWLDENRAHDANMISLVNEYLPEHDTEGLDISILKPEDAINAACATIRTGADHVSCTGNVLRDYLTDLFPILELGTSAKMLSIVPMLNQGAMFETGAGGSAPKHVQQFTKEGHLRWDSLGEYLAMGESFRQLGERTGNEKVLALGETLTKAVGELLDDNNSPSRKVNEIDNRGSHFHVAANWAKYQAEVDPAFQPLADALAENAEQILGELIDCQGEAVDIGGYWKPDEDKVTPAMRPSQVFNDLIDNY
jgi:isocitrate dehydrogenase